MSTDKGLPQLGMVCGLLAAGLFWAGCRTPASQPDVAGGSTAPAPAAPQAAAVGAAGDTRAAGPAASGTTSDLLRVGDSVNVTLLDLPDRQPSLVLTIKEDGSITLPLLNHQVQAADKTTGQLQEDIKRSYVPAYYKHMTVIVVAQGQYYSVKGEVKSPNRYGYANATTVLKAIASAGDFTDFARKAKVQVYRSNGKIETEDCIKALRDPKLDLPVYPGDLINVPRRKTPFQR
jgi:polysaccharide export outer membrane protein